MRTMIAAVRVLGVLMVSSSLIACDDNSSDPQPEEYITTPSGLQYLDLEVGNGRPVRAGDRLTVHYTVWLEDGTKIDSSHDRGEPFNFNIGLGQVIEGWEEGVASMRVGGRRRLIIPPDLGYGDAGLPPVIPPNAVLVSEVDLLNATGSESILH